MGEAGPRLGTQPGPHRQIPGAEGAGRSPRERAEVAPAPLSVPTAPPFVFPTVSEASSSPLPRRRSSAGLRQCTFFVED